ncbi:hypothetical protein SeMB42_g04948 [Synchytrium endobioticum]|uniref:Fe2OG dioxygenase domain-containing protein n=1 Tax=Synchytrium endobioticum TaxID=286115 RepID=A0A507CVH4_9FUNG|nr:hypothetical protein SeMB42_g04948 [Synchytrium endobioticum]
MEPTSSSPIPMERDNNSASNNATLETSPSDSSSPSPPTTTNPVSLNSVAEWKQSEEGSTTSVEASKGAVTDGSSASTEGVLSQVGDAVVESQYARSSSLHESLDVQDDASVDWGGVRESQQHVRPRFRKPVTPKPIKLRHRPSQKEEDFTCTVGSSNVFSTFKSSARPHQPCRKRAPVRGSTIQSLSIAYKAQRGEHQHGDTIKAINLQIINSCNRQHEGKSNESIFAMKRVENAPRPATVDINSQVETGNENRGIDKLLWMHDVTSMREVDHNHHDDDNDNDNDDVCVPALKIGVSTLSPCDHAPKPIRLRYDTYLSMVPIRQQQDDDKAVKQNPRARKAMVDVLGSGITGCSLHSTSTSAKKRANVDKADMVAGPGTTLSVVNVGFPILQPSHLPLHPHLHALQCMPMSTLKHRRPRKDDPHASRDTDPPRILAKDRDEKAAPPDLDLTNWKTLVQYFYPWILTVIAAVSYIAYTRYRDTGTTILSATDTFRDAWFDLTCSDSTLPIVKGCTPSACGRYVHDSFATPDEIRILRMIADKAMNLSVTDSCASIFDVPSGAVTHGSKFMNVYELIKKSRKEGVHVDWISADEVEVLEGVQKRIQQQVKRIFSAKSIKLAKPSFFSRLNGNPQRALTEHDEYWHAHVDREQYGTFAFTGLLYLSTQQRDFSGGEFVFLSENGRHDEVKIQPKAGRLSLFTSGSENRHRVEKVVKGRRYALTVAFECRDDDQGVHDILAISNKVARVSYLWWSPLQVYKLDIVLDALDLKRMGKDEKARVAGLVCLCTRVESLHKDTLRFSSIVDLDTLSLVIDPCGAIVEQLPCLPVSAPAPAPAPPSPPQPFGVRVYCHCEQSWRKANKAIGKENEGPSASSHTPTSNAPMGLNSPIAPPPMAAGPACKSRCKSGAHPIAQSNNMDHAELSDKNTHSLNSTPCREKDLFGGAAGAVLLGEDAHHILSFYDCGSDLSCSVDKGNHLIPAAADRYGMSRHNSFSGMDGHLIKTPTLSPSSSCSTLNKFSTTSKHDGSAPIVSSPPTSSSSTMGLYDAEDYMSLSLPVVSNADSISIKCAFAATPSPHHHHHPHQRGLSTISTGNNTSGIPPAQGVAPAMYGIQWNYYHSPAGDNVPHHHYPSIPFSPTTSMGFMCSHSTTSMPQYMYAGNQPYYYYAPTGSYYPVMSHQQSQYMQLQQPNNTTKSRRASLTSRNGCITTHLTPTQSCHPYERVNSTTGYSTATRLQTTPPPLTHMPSPAQVPQLHSTSHHLPTTVVPATVAPIATSVAAMAAAHSNKPITGIIKTAVSTPSTSASSSTATSPLSRPITSKSAKEAPAQEDGAVRSAVYSNVQVYEFTYRGVALMKRKRDGFMNATQILKLAGIDKGRRTKILEKEVHPGEHEKVQGGYGKYQGTWVPLTRGIQIAQQYGVNELIRPLTNHIRDD